MSEFFWFNNLLEYDSLDWRNIDTLIASLKRCHFMNDMNDKHNTLLMCRVVNDLTLLVYESHNHNMLHWCITCDTPVDTYQSHPFMLLTGLENSYGISGIIPDNNLIWSAFHILTLSDDKLNSKMFNLSATECRANIIHMLVQSQ